MCAHVCLKLPQILAKMCYTAIESHLELNKCVSLSFAQCLKHVPSFSSCFQVHALGLCDYQINVCQDLPSSYTNKSVACDQMLLQGDWLLFYRGSTLYWDSQPPPPKYEIAISQSKVVPIVWVHPREKGLQVSNSLIWIWIRKKGEKKWPSTHSVFFKCISFSRFPGLTQSEYSEQVHIHAIPNYIWTELKNPIWNII